MNYLNVEVKCEYGKAKDRTGTNKARKSREKPTGEVFGHISQVAQSPQWVPDISRLINKSSLIKRFCP